jgi:hypothetical protein
LGFYNFSILSVQPAEKFTGLHVRGGRQQFW